MTAPDQTRLGIGAVLELLRPDFPDVSISKIRFLEAEGLVAPERTTSGYRKYGAADVERLRFILTAQRDRFWPLKVIRERLDAMDRGLVPDDDGRPAVPVAEAGGGALLGERPAVRLRLTPEELRQTAGIDLETYRELVSYGLLDRSATHHDGAALDIARAAGALVASGIEVRHLRPFRTAAEREVGLVEHVLGQRGLRGRSARAEGIDDATAAREVAEQCLALHAALVERQLDGL